LPVVSRIPAILADADISGRIPDGLAAYWAERFLTATSAGEGEETLATAFLAGGHQMSKGRPPSKPFRNASKRSASSSETGVRISNMHVLISAPCMRHSRVCHINLGQVAALAISCGEEKNDNGWLIPKGHQDR
jgi:hypothetical protein